MPKSDARIAADKRFEESRESVLVRFTKAEIEAIDAARGDMSRPKWVQAKAAAAAKRLKPRSR